MTFPLTRRQLGRLAAGTTATALAPLAGRAAAQGVPPWAEVQARARGQTVYWNAWAGDDKTNAFIAWCGEQLKASHGVSVQHVRLKDTAEAVTRVVAEKTAGRNAGGSVDLIWINGPNFLNMKQQALLYGPVTQALPNFRFVDTVNKRSNVVDFTTPVDGMAVPWRLAQIAFVYDSARLKNPAELPRSADAMLAWARTRPGRLTHPNVANFLGATFLKQALHDLTPDPAVLQQAATPASFAAVSAPLWAWYDALRPLLWRRGAQFPETGAAQRELLSDGEIDITVTFDPTEAPVAVAAGRLPKTVRTFTFTRGSIGNTSFVAIPYNARAKEGALVLANFLIEPATQAHAQNLNHIGCLNVLDLARLTPAERRAFDPPADNPAMPSAADLGRPALEPHASWMTLITAEWQKRYTR